MGHIRTSRARSLTSQAAAGFSVVELIVVAGIIGVLSIILVVNQNAFNRSVILKNTAADIALSLWSAQTYGIGTRAVGTISNAGYGIDFSIGNSFTFFADTDPGAGGLHACRKVPLIIGSSAPSAIAGDCFYRLCAAGGGCTEDQLFAQAHALNNGMEVTNFCAYEGTTAEYCYQGGSNANMQRLAIVFTRPNTSAEIRMLNSGGAIVGNTDGDNSTGATFTSACVTVSSPYGASRGVLVSKLGQVSLVEACP